MFETTNQDFSQKRLVAEASSGVIWLWNLQTKNYGFERRCVRFLVVGLIFKVNLFSYLGAIYWVDVFFF
jgi:hypothetical protein